MGWWGGRERESAHYTLLHFVNCISVFGLNHRKGPKVCLAYKTSIEMFHFLLVVVAN